MAGEIILGSQVGVGGGAQAIRPTARLETPLSDEEKAFYAGIVGEPQAPPAREDNTPVGLVVDNDPRLRGIMKESLVGIGLRVFEAKDGATALKEYASRMTDLILLDLILPVMDGYKLIRGIRSYFGDARAVVCCVGDTQDDRDEVAALNLGADNFMMKPYTLDRIRAHVRSVFRAKKSGL
ncbi:MAG: hypothetical protein COB53_03880 [Elusimicrobia bacterium]|nr:MAG: hypothetical protein COB53_03880 [Elusimicrobiota bacterium]